MEKAQPKVANQPTKIKPLQGAALPDMPVVISLPKDQVRTVEVGDEVTVTVTGEVYVIRKLSNENPDKENYEIELRKPKVIEVKSNMADMALKKMVEQK